MLLKGVRIGTLCKLVGSIASDGCKISIVPEIGDEEENVSFLHMRYEIYSIYYYNNECSIYREHKVTIHERMHPLNNQ